MAKAEGRVNLSLFDEPPTSLTADESAVYEVIRHATSTAPISLARVAILMHHRRTTESERKTSDRSIKETVSALRRRGLPIGSSRRRGSSGYFLIANADDIDRFLQQFMAQVRTEAQTARAVAGSARIKRILGQIAIDLEAA